jgi:rod shape-determining protein MreC
MPLGTLDRSPPPFFRQGPSALTQLAFFAAAAVFLMVADSRWRFVEPLRAGLATALLPVQRALLEPVQWAAQVADHFSGLEAARRAEGEARASLARQAEASARGEQLARENAQLRALLDLKPAVAVASQAASVLYEAADPFSRKLFIDRGQAQGLKLGSPVVNEHGVIGQVTRLYPLSAEVTLLTDRDAAIPVLNTRTQARGAAFGGAAWPGLELRFMAANADVQVGDSLTTSGLDGIYPPGLAVARVASVERRGETGFARILLEPAVQADAVRHVLVLEPLAALLPPRPAPEAAAAKAAASVPGRRREAGAAP